MDEKQEMLKKLEALVEKGNARRLAVTMLDQDGEEVEVEVVDIRFEGGVIYVDCE